MYSFKIPDVWDFGSVDPRRQDDLLDLLRVGHNGGGSPGGIDFLDGLFLDFGEPPDLRALDFKSEKVTVEYHANIWDSTPTVWSRRSFPDKCAGVLLLQPANDFGLIEAVSANDKMQENAEEKM